ncbi:MAG TPA: hypothetical protein P5248_04850 [Bacteroidales bacterium]|nr:hypothetical protein [Bacteroidales bacterium]
MSEPGQDKIKEIARLLRILYGALVAGALFLMVVAILLVEVGGGSLAPVDPSFSRYLLVFLLVLVATSLPAGMVLFRKQMIGVQGRETMEVLNAYRSALVVRGALAEGVSFFGTIVYLIQHNYTALIIAFVVICYMILLFPHRGRMERDTGLELP